jgi:adenosylcobinamide-GDP ribazoletransferase
MCLKAITALLQFTTILPLGKSIDFEYFARRSYLYPVAGYVIGAIVAICVFFIELPSVAAAVAIVALFLITGCNHFDGLLDFGDGVMAHGTREKRVNALTDQYIGAGGVAIGIGITLIAFAALQESQYLLYTIVIAEVCAKFSMGFLTAFGLPFCEGIHSYLHRFSRPYFPLYSAVLCIPLVLLPVPRFLLLAAGAIALFCPLILLLIAIKLFGGINGDVVGASNEITRSLVFLSMVIVQSMLS